MGKLYWRPRKRKSVNFEYFFATTFIREVLARIFLSFAGIDRKSTRLNSSHLVISYAVFCLKKKNTDAAGHPASQSVRLSTFDPISLPDQVVAAMGGRALWRIHDSGSYMDTYTT